MFKYHEGELSQKLPEPSMWWLVNYTNPKNILHWISFNSGQLQNNTVNGAISITINWVIMTVILIFLIPLIIITISIIYHFIFITIVFIIISSSVVIIISVFLLSLVYFVCPFCIMVWLLAKAICYLFLVIYCFCYWNCANILWITARSI